MQVKKYKNYTQHTGKNERLSKLAQENINTDELVGFGCSYGGEPTKIVEKTTQLLSRKNYRKISKMLSSKNSGAKYLSVISLEWLAQNRAYQLNDKEKKLIAEAKLSEELLAFCAGCTYLDKIALKKALA